MARRFRAAAIPQARKGLGEATPWSEADLARLSEVTEKDKQSARQFWLRHAPPELRSLLDAKRWEGDD